MSDRQVLLEVRAALENTAVEQVAARACNALKLIDVALCTTWYEPAGRRAEPAIELKREYTAEHKPGFLWSENAGMFEESDTRLRKRFHVEGTYRELMAGVYRNAGTTLYAMMVADVALRIERATERYELDSAMRAIPLTAIAGESDLDLQARLLKHLRGLV